MASLEKGDHLKIIEWRPICFEEAAFENLSAAYAKRLHLFTLAFLLPILALGHLSSDWPIAWQILPFYLSLFILGMPHGGADHLLLWGIVKKSSVLIQSASIIAYISIALIYLIFWHYIPIFSTIFFIILTIFHWGQGDRFISIKLHRANYLKRSKAASFTHILVRGSIPVLLPGFRGNETYHSFLETIVREGGGFQFELNWIKENQFLFLLVPLLLSFLYFALCFCKIIRGEDNAILTDFFETFALSLWFILIPPIWALGCYFLFWHSLRHCLRILWTDSYGRSYLKNGRYVKAKVRWIQITGLMTIIALIGLWYILSVPYNFNGIHLEWLGKVMIGISILTLPHTLVVCLMDKIQLRN